MTTSTAAGTSSENDFSFIQSYYACKLRSNFAEMKLVPGNVYEDDKENYVVKPCPPYSLKQGDFKVPSTHGQASRTLISTPLSFKTTETTRALLLQRDSMTHKT